MTSMPVIICILYVNAVSANTAAENQ